MEVLDLDWRPDERSLTPDQRRAKLFALEGALKAGNADGSLVPFECPLQHFFGPGVYVRQMLIPAGVALVGHIHREACVNLVLGEIMVASESGLRRVVGPITFASAAGIKRAGYAIQNTLWTTIHSNPDNERDVARLEARLIIDVYDPISGLPRQDLLEGVPCSNGCTTISHWGRSQP